MLRIWPILKIDFFSWIWPKKLKKFKMKFFRKIFKKFWPLKFRKNSTKIWSFFPNFLPWINYPYNLWRPKKLSRNVRTKWAKIFPIIPCKFLSEIFDVYSTFFPVKILTFVYQFWSMRFFWSVSN